MELCVEVRRLLRLLLSSSCCGLLLGPAFPTVVYLVFFLSSTLIHEVRTVFLNLLLAHLQQLIYSYPDISLNFELLYYVPIALMVGLVLNLLSFAEH